jgi:hypothetical protein
MARLTEILVFPTPPLPLVTAITLARRGATGSPASSVEGLLTRFCSRISDRSCVAWSITIVIFTASSVEEPHGICDFQFAICD